MGIVVAVPIVAWKLRYRPGELRGRWREVALLEGPVLGASRRSLVAQTLHHLVAIAILDAAVIEIAVLITINAAVAGGVLADFGLGAAVVRGRDAVWLVRWQRRDAACIPSVHRAISRTATSSSPRAERSTPLPRCRSSRFGARAPRSTDPSLAAAARLPRQTL